MAKGKRRRRPSDPTFAIKLFSNEHPELELHKRGQRDLIRFLVYWAVDIHGVIAVHPALLTSLFDGLALNPPANPANALAKLKYEDELVKNEVGYLPSAPLREAMKHELSSAPPLLRAEPHIRILLKRITRPSAKSFLDEAYLCMRANAPRAAIVLTWIVVMDHLYEYVLANKLHEFTRELAKKNWKISSINTKDDFAEIKKDKDFIELCRAANVFNNDVKKILDEKLGIRNTAGHPSTVTVSGTKAANFIEDLVENVVLKFPI